MVLSIYAIEFHIPVLDLIICTHIYFNMSIYASSASHLDNSSDSLL